MAVADSAEIAASMGEPGYVVPGSMRQDPRTLQGGVTLGPSAEWTDAAATWAVRIVSRETDGPVMRAHELGAYETPGPVTTLHLVCAACDQSVMCLSPDASSMGYTFTDAEQRAQILAHLRRSHAGVVAS